MPAGTVGHLRARALTPKSRQTAWLLAWNMLAEWCME
jgi:hypothetical protein